MKLGTIHAFPSPMAYMTLGEESRLLNAAIMNDVNDILNEQQTKNRSGYGVSQSRLGLEKRFTPIQELKYIVDNIFNNGASNFFGIESDQNVNSCKFWLNHNTSSSAFHMPHTHNLSDLISGVYFPSSGIQDGIELSDNQNLDEEVLIKTGRTDDGDIVFTDVITARGSMIGSSKVVRYPFYGSPICVTPRAGTLLLFASWMPHMVAPTRKENFTRTSIAFAVNVKPANA